MNIMQFSEIINHDNLERNMHRYFDEHVAMYNIINGYDIGVQISASESNATIVYTVTPKAGYDINNLISVLSNAVITAYGNAYAVNINQVNNQLTINLLKRTSSY